MVVGAVSVVVVVLGGGGHGVQTLPPPSTTTPPSAMQAVASGATRAVDLVQSVLTSQVRVGSLLHVPLAIMSPGVVSLQVPRS